jgi:hypothetical protein
MQIQSAVATLWFSRAIVMGLCSLAQLEQVTGDDKIPLGPSTPLNCRI